MYPPQNMIRVMKPNALALAGHEVRAVEKYTHTGVRWETRKESDPLVDLGIDERIIIKWIPNVLNGGGLRKSCNGTSGSIRCDHLINYWLFKDTISWPVYDLSS